jgi:hypothetical protein
MIGTACTPNEQWKGDALTGIPVTRLRSHIARSRHIAETYANTTPYGAAQARQYRSNPHHLPMSLKHERECRLLVEADV